MDRLTADGAIASARVCFVDDGSADRTWAMSALFEGSVAIPVFLLATLALLPFAKGGVIGFAWAVGVTRNPTADF